MITTVYKSALSFVVGSLVLITVASCSRAEKDAPAGTVAKTTNSPKIEQQAAPQHRGPITGKERQVIQYTLKQLASAADQLYLEGGKTKTTYNELVGPDKYILRVEQVAGEDYRQILFEHGKPLSVTTASGEVVTLVR